jgi:hypothetical protein
MEVRLHQANGQTSVSDKEMTLDQQEIQSLKKQLWCAKRDK